MATFITTIEFTAKGVKDIQDSPKRAAAFTAAAKKMGVNVTGIYWTLGSFDGAIIFEAPDDQVATAAMLSLASEGNVQTKTSRAFDVAEIEKVIGIVSKK
ncbi:MAG: GYD domain-containing protein [Planctomycetota bacterium]|nr:MAG: GYD domain-containing protein [Planctomycetota bacterium]